MKIQKNHIRTEAKSLMTSMILGLMSTLCYVPPIIKIDYHHGMMLNPVTPHAMWKNLTDSLIGCMLEKVLAEFFVPTTNYVRWIGCIFSAAEG